MTGAERLGKGGCNQRALQLDILKPLNEVKGKVTCKKVRGGGRI